MDYDLMGDPESVLSDSQIRKRADRALFRNEFAVAFQEPVVDPLDEEGASARRAYLSVWVRGAGIDADYEREYCMSGDEEMIQRMFRESVDDNGTGSIESILDN